MSTRMALAVVLPAAALLLAQTSALDQIGQLRSPKEEAALATTLLQESRAPAAAVARVWQGTDPGARAKARAVLNDMEEAALDPLLKANGALPADDQVWRMTMVVETLGELRHAAAAMLDRQLTNRKPAPLPASAALEEHEPPRRVCDEAYMLMSRLTAADPESPGFVLQMRQFLRLSEARRDVEIQRARRSASWRALTR